jgi:hypothetical protein
MKLSEKSIAELRKLLKDQLGLDYDDQQANEAGTAIIRFVVAKERRAAHLASQDNGDRNGKNRRKSDIVRG